ncbi:MAG: diguanylate cyclase [Desulfobacterales bacterium]|nr:diguanylate cyclase [Desulfobacterales bacterium]
MIENKRFKLLLVDDMKANLNMLKMVLGKEYDIATARDGKSALEYVAANPGNLDLILLDIIMPDMDGYEVCRGLKEDVRTSGIPIMFITSMNEEEDESKGLELGAVDYITKPFSKPIIRARVKNHLTMKRQRDLLENLSNMDGLTGIANRRNFNRVLEIEWYRALRASTPLSLIMMDIDYFKKYNDNYGHAAGDECLRQVARTLDGCTNRASDFVARYGGEEFSAILPGTESVGGLVLAEKMRKSVEALNIEHVASSAALHITISQGVATMIPRRELSAVSLIEAADAALYEAKKAGRNRARVHEPNSSE